MAATGILSAEILLRNLFPDAGSLAPSRDPLLARAMENEPLGRRRLETAGRFLSLRRRGQDASGRRGVGEQLLANVRGPFYRVTRSRSCARRNRLLTCAA